MEVLLLVALAATLLGGAATSVGAAARMISTLRKEGAPVVPLVVLALTMLLFVAASVVAILIGARRGR